MGKAISRKGRQQLGAWCNHPDCVIALGGLLAVLCTLWLGWKYDQLHAIWKLWPRSGNHGIPATTPWRSDVVNITVLAGAVDSGAVCLDGSPPAYYWDRGRDDGVNNWVVFLEGGAWCDSDDTCFERSHSELGSSRFMSPKMRMKGILSPFSKENPDFHKWNRVFVKYCDGGSLSGNVNDPVEVHYKTIQQSKVKVGTIFYRGQRIWTAVMKDLLANGMDKAEKAFLTGCSAGGLASILHCDQYRDLMPKEATVKCSSDGGFFIQVPDITGAPTIERYYARVIRLQNMAKNLPKSCTSQRDAVKCFFPEYSIADIKTPFFVLNSAYDQWQVMNVLVPRSADPERDWDSCSHSRSSCSPIQMEALQGFREGFMERVQPLLNLERHGAFISSCYFHCETWDATWIDKSGAKFDGKSSSQAIGDWYFERNSSKLVDCPYPCNPKCTKR